jgi:hypothetical protein
MLQHHKVMHLFIIGLLPVCLLFTRSTAKSRSFNPTGREFPVRMSPAEVRSLEQRLTQHFTGRSPQSGSGRKSLTVAAPASESDVLLLSKVWNFLSPEFLKMYKEAVRPPIDFDSYESPGGHFEILYTTEGIRGVDTTDRYGYGSPDWRVRTGGPNGVPDYIDETAFALDSSWSMEIDRFGFIPPHSFTDSTRSSDRYIVVVDTVGDNYYGVTNLQSALPGGRGFSSTITLRNEWNEWGYMGYDTTPEAAVQVTCAHEFFHAIQYAMSWHVFNLQWLDDFPVSWTEGCAVTMEELAFDSVDDYHQYSGTYFTYPGYSFFSPQYNDDIYTNGILLLYIFYHLPSGPGIDFIHTMHFNNYKNRTPFPDNLQKTCTGLGTQWVTLLHSFHTASFFTGTRADPARFIPDAADFSIRKGQEVTMPKTLSKEVGSNSASLLWFTPSKNQLDTLSILFEGTPGVTRGFSPANWAISLLVQKNGTDSLIPLSVSREGKASFIMTPWTSLDEAILVTTNADPVIIRDYTIALNVDSIVISNSIDLYPNPVSIQRNKSTVYVGGTDISDIAIYSLRGTLLWRLPDRSVTTLPGRQRYELACRNKNGTSFSRGTYSVIITRDELSDIKPHRSRKKLLITP